MHVTLLMKPDNLHGISAKIGPSTFFDVLASMFTTVELV